ncbi:MAG: TraR/DksA family transcriptional regulator [Nitrospira sp.]|nr:TraR/DksA family transcriptional regulator [Nitrospira sp.]
MAGKVKVKKKVSRSTKASAKAGAKRTEGRAKKLAGAVRPDGARASGSMNEKGPAKLRRNGRREALHRMLTAKRQEVLNEIGTSIGQSLTEDQQRRLESAMDVGDQALMDLERELGISLLEMRNRKRQLIDEALVRLDEGTYGVCAECGVEISEKRLVAVPFAKLCVVCQSKQELIEKIEKGEERD